MICIFIFHYSDKFYLRYMFHMFHKVCKGIPMESIFWFFFWKYQEIQNFLYPLVKCPIFLELKRKLSQCHIPPNIRLDEDVFRLRLQKTSSRRLQDVLIKTNMFALALRLQKTSSRRLGQDQYIRLGYTSSRRLQNVLQKRLQDIFKTSSRRFEDVFKTSCKDIFKMFSRRIIKLNCSCFREVLQRRLSTEGFA